MPTGWCYRAIIRLNGLQKMKVPPLNLLIGPAREPARLARDASPRFIYPKTAGTVVVFVNIHCCQSIWEWPHK